MNRKVGLVKIAGQILDISSKVGGVFSYADLSSIIASGSVVQNSRVISRLIKEKLLMKIQRGIYITKIFDSWLLASRLEPNCYISMDTLLAKEVIIATLPKRVVSAVIFGKRFRRIATPEGDILFHSICEDLYFGIITMSSGIKVAEPEKAYLDLLYFYQKGSKFSIDPLTEVNMAKLDKKIINKYLAKYKNPKFIKFVQELLYDK